MFDSKFTFKRHIHSISLSVTQNIGLLRKSFRFFRDQDVLFRIFQFYPSFFGVLLFIPATTKLWNDLPSMSVEAVELQKLNLCANTCLLGVVRP